MAAYQAFKEPTLISDPLKSLIDSDFSKFEARQLRYAIFWSFYENTAYRDIHSWAKGYRVQHGLYKYIRNIYNPAYALGEFYKSHLWGGVLNPLLMTDDERLGQAIDQIYTWSNWASTKDLASLYGSILGDVGLAVRTDTMREKIYIDVIHPGVIKSITLDDFGNVKAYEIEEERPHPDGRGQAVTYGEIVTRDGQDVIYTTTLNGRPYAWNDEVEQWVDPLGFVPLVMVQHNRVGLDWGWSELHPSRSKIHEVDDLASKLSDQVRKMVEAPALLGGVSKPSTTPTATQTTPTTAGRVNDPQPGREEIPIFYGSIGATYTPMVAPLDLTGTSEYIKTILNELQEREHPELTVTQAALRADNSGRAIRLARQATEVKVRQRRVGYDDALERANKMAVAIAGHRGYIQGYGLDSFEAGALDHTIPDRPVFATDPMDDIEIEMAFWEAAVKAKEAGLPLTIFLQDKPGWSDERIADLIDTPEFQSRLAMMELGMVGNG